MCGPNLGIILSDIWLSLTTAPYFQVFNQILHFLAKIGSFQYTFKLFYIFIRTFKYVNNIFIFSEFWPKMGPHTRLVLITSGHLPNGVWPNLAAILKIIQHPKVMISELSVPKDIGQEQVKVSNLV